MRKNRSEYSANIMLSEAPHVVFRKPKTTKPVRLVRADDVARWVVYFLAGVGVLHFVAPLVLRALFGAG